MKSIKEVTPEEADEKSDKNNMNKFLSRLKLYRAPTLAENFETGTSRAVTKHGIPVFLHSPLFSSPPPLLRWMALFITGVEIRCAPSCLRSCAAPSSPSAHVGHCYSRPEFP